jgi:hypothetical protein
MHSGGDDSVGVGALSDQFTFELIGFDGSTDEATEPKPHFHVKN